jgi:SOS-response transcriptional repressor LexA
MSRRRLQVLDIIKSEIAATGRWPSAQMIADEMEWNTTSGVPDCLSALCRYGYLKRIKEDGPLMSRFVVVDK